MNPRRIVRWWLAALAGAVTLSLGVAVPRPGPAAAHALLERSLPADRAQLTEAPDRVDLYFGQQLVQNRTGTFAVVLDRGGRRVSNEASVDPADGTHLRVPLRGGLDSGAYTVFWKTTSDDDGGVTLGSLTFFLGPPDAQTVAAVVPAGQAPVPDDVRTQALSVSAPAAHTTRALLLGLLCGGAAGMVAGGGVVYLVARRRARPATTASTQRRPRARR